MSYVVIHVFVVNSYCCLIYENNNNCYRTSAGMNPNGECQDLAGLRLHQNHTKLTESKADTIELAWRVMVVLKYG
jgi:hypothetical protein